MGGVEYMPGRPGGHLSVYLAGGQNRQEIVSHVDGAAQFGNW